MSNNKKLYIKKHLLGGFVISLLCLSLLGCDSIRDGQIYNKEHQPEHNYYTIILMPLYTGNTTSYIPVPYYVIDDEDFIIDIKKWDEQNCKYLTARLYVTKETYEKLNVGDYFSCEGSICEDVDMDIKTRR